MQKFWRLNITLVLILMLAACSSAGTPTPTATPRIVANANNPCPGLPAPEHWRHIVVLMFENQTYEKVIGPAPYITGLAHKCATAPTWMDANTKVDGSPDG